jgi:hypothetical protein
VAAYDEISAMQNPITYTAYPETPNNRPFFAPTMLVNGFDRKNAVIAYPTYRIPELTAPMLSPSSATA